MTQIPPSQRERRLFVDGERLRITVEQPPSSGGSHYEPQTAAEARELLMPLVSSAAAQAKQLPAELRGERLYIEAQLLPNYLAPSHFPAALLAEVGAITVGSRAAPDVYRTARREQEAVTRRLILALDDSGLDRFQRLIESPGRNRSEQSAFNEIRKLNDIALRSPDQVVVRLPLDEDADITWEAVLHPMSTSGGDPVPIDDETVEKWFRLVEQFGGMGHRLYVRQVGGLTFAPVVLRSSAALNVAQFNPLRVLRPMPAIRPTPTISLRQLNKVLPPISHDPIGRDLTVAVFDGGVDNQSATSPVFPIADTDLTTEAPLAMALFHGTAVAGAILYGMVTPGMQLPSPPLPLDSYRVFPLPSIPGLDEYWLLDEIKRVVSEGDYRIVNLSLGPDVAVEDSGEPNRWTSELDHLASELDVLFVIAAGNGGENDRATGLHRVQVPGDMVNGLAVGACDTPPPDSSWTRTRYSSMGPGRHGNRIQPSGVQFGGHAQRPFPLLTGTGSVEECQEGGTSFATPLVTHALADLAHRLPRPTASVLRAFAVHFAEKPRRGHAFEEIGHGRFPLSFEQYLNCVADEAHILFEDEIDRGQRLGYRIPLPGEIIGPIELDLTLVYVSPVEASQPTEYTRVSLDLSLRPNQYVHAFNPLAGSGLRRQTLDYRTEEAIALIQSGWVMSQEPITKSLGTGPRSPEIDLRNSGKWETVRRHRIRINKGEFNNPRIEVTHIARRNGRLTYESEPVRFALLVTVHDKSGSGELYDLVKSQYPSLRPLAKVASRVRIHRQSR